MKFGCSIESVNMRSSSPNFFNKFSKSYWINYFKHVGASGYKGIELAYNPYSSDPISFEIGRCGVPISTFAVNAKYGSIKSFLEMLNNYGIDEVTSVHVKPGDALLELLASETDLVEYFSKFKELALEALDFLCNIEGQCLIISPTPEIGMLEKYFGINSDKVMNEFIGNTIGLINEIIKAAADRGKKTAVRNEYWSLFYGQKVESLLNKLDSSCIYSPDLAHLAISKCNPMELIKKYKNRLGYIVFSDTSFNDEYENYKKINAEIPVIGAQRVFCDLGCGKVDLIGIYKALNEIKYDGWIICDNKKTLDVQKSLLNTRWFIDRVLLKA